MLSSVRQRGFNMIEVAVTLAVLGLLVAATLPSVAEWIQSLNVRNTAETLQNGLQKARNEAMKRNQVVTFWLVAPKPDASCALSSASAAWVISLDDPTGKCADAASATVAPRIVEVYGPEGSTGVTVKAVDKDDADAESVSFNGFGQAVAAATPIDHIDVEHSGGSGRRLRVQISSSGGIRMCDRGVTAPDTRACN